MGPPHLIFKNEKHASSTDVKLKTRSFNSKHWTFNSKRIQCIQKCIFRSCLRRGCFVLGSRKHSVCIIQLSLLGFIPPPLTPLDDPDECSSGHPNVPLAHDKTQNHDIPRPSALLSRARSGSIQGHLDRALSEVVSSESAECAKAEEGTGRPRTCWTPPGVAQSFSPRNQ